MAEIRRKVLRQLQIWESLPLAGTLPRRQTDTFATIWLIDAKTFRERGFATPQAGATEESQPLRREDEPVFKGEAPWQSR